MHVLHSVKNLHEKLLALMLAEATLELDTVEKIAIGTILGDDEAPLSCGTS